MKKIVLLITLVLFSICGSKGQDLKNSKKINVLFIGNSLTYYNNMPEMLQEMLCETDPGITIEQISYPGFSLYAHLEDIIEESSENSVKTRKKVKGETTETEKKIQEKKWDIIVMQTGGISILIPEIRNQKIDPAIREILNLSNCESKYMLFNTWITKTDYPQKYCYPAVVIDKYAKPGEKFCSPEITNEDDFHKLLEAGYRELAAKNKLTLTNHAQQFKEATENHPEINLLEDSMHPSDNGAYLSASIFYELITGKKATNLKYVAHLKYETASILKESL